MKMPPLGFGTWRTRGSDSAEAVADALRIGYRHIDTARMYGNEREVGVGLRASGVPRDEVFVTTKVWLDQLEPDQVRASCEASLADLGLDAVDLLLVHWPNPAVPLADTLGAMVALREEGLIRDLGVSNFTSTLLREACALAPVTCNQLEYHPFLGQSAVLAVAREHDVTVTAYRPVAGGRVARDATLRAIGAAHGRSPAQVALRWLLDQPHVAAVPKSASRERRRENFDLAFTLTHADRARIAALPKDERIVDLEFSPEWDPPDAPGAPV